MNLHLKVLLHIGQSKTGTSAIQAFLTLNRQRLIQNGILYPSVKVGNMPLNLGSHNAVADSLLGHIRFPNLSASEYFYQFFNDAKKINAKLLILSAEHFFGGEPRIWNVKDKDEYFERYQKKIENLAIYLKGHDVTILAYIRPQIEWMASAIAQTIRIERLISKKQVYIDDRQFYELMKPLLRYADLLDCWQQNIKPQSFIIVPYIRNMLHNRSSIADFLKRTGLDSIDFDYADPKLQVNISLNPELIEVKKILNKFIKTKNEERTVIRCMENMSKINPVMGEYSLDPEVQREIESYVSKQNDRINQIYMKDGMSIVANSRTHPMKSPPKENEVISTLQAFETEFKRPKYKLKYWDFVLRSFLRTYASPIHSALHQFKAMHWWWKYGK